MRTDDCSEFETRATHHVAGVVQAGGFIALIDVERGTVIGTTGTSLFAPSSTELAKVFPFLQERLVTTLIGGPTPGVETRCAEAFSEEDPELPTEVAGTATLPTVGPTEFALPGLYRADIEAVAGIPLGISASSSELEMVYFTGDGINKAVRLISPASHITGTLTLLSEGRACGPAHD